MSWHPNPPVVPQPSYDSDGSDFVVHSFFEIEAEESAHEADNDEELDRLQRYIDERRRERVFKRRVRCRYN